MNRAAAAGLVFVMDAWKFFSIFKAQNKKEVSMSGSRIKTLEDLMNVDVRSVEDIDNSMKMDNNDYPIDDVKFETPLELERYKTEWKDYEKFCIR